MFFIGVIRNGYIMEGGIAHTEDDARIKIGTLFHHYLGYYGIEAEQEMLQHEVKRGYLYNREDTSLVFQILVI